MRITIFLLMHLLLEQKPALHRLLPLKNMNIMRSTLQWRRKYGKLYNLPYLLEKDILPPQLWKGIMYCLENPPSTSQIFDIDALAKVKLFSSGTAAVDARKPISGIECCHNKRWFIFKRSPLVILNLGLNHRFELEFSWISRV